MGRPGSFCDATHLPRTDASGQSRRLGDILKPFSERRRVREVGVSLLLLWRGRTLRSETLDTLESYVSDYEFDGGVTRKGLHGSINCKNSDFCMSKSITVS